MASFKYLDMNKIDPGWARKHKWTLWASGVSPNKVDQICAKPSFSELAKAAENEQALDETIAKAKEEGAQEALQKAVVENKPAQKNNTAKPAAPKDTTVNIVAVPASNFSAATKNVDSEEKKGGSGKPNFAFSADDDKKLLELKNENKSWKEIAKEMKKPQDALKNRFKEIGSDDEKPVPQKKESKKESKKAGRGKPNESSAAQSQMPKQEAGQGGEDWDLQTIADAEGAADDGYMVLYPDSIFNEDALVAMARAMYEDYDNFYQRIVSRIFDATGQRFSESAVKRKLASARNKATPPPSEAHFDTRSYVGSI